MTQKEKALAVSRIPGIFFFLPRLLDLLLQSLGGCFRSSFNAVTRGGHPPQRGPKPEAAPAHRDVLPGEVGAKHPREPQLTATASSRPTLLLTTPPELQSWLMQRRLMVGPPDDRPPAYLPSAQSSHSHGVDSSGLLGPGSLLAVLMETNPGRKYSMLKFELPVYLGE